MNPILFFSVFIGLGIMYAILGIATSQKIYTTNDYFLAGRNLGIASVMFTLVATQLGSGMLLGTTQQAYTIGLYGLMYTLGMCFGLILLALGFAAKLRSLNVATTAELFETKYKSPGLKKFASLLSIITFSGILISQVIASRALLASLGFANEPLLVAFWLFTIIYTMLGGLKAVVVTDIAQVIFIIIIFSGLFLYSIFIEPSSLFTMFNGQQQFAAANFNMQEIAATLLMPIFFSLIEQDLAQRFFAARTPRIATLSAFGAAVCLILFALIPIYFGMKANIMEIIIPEGTSPLIPVLETFTNDIVMVFAVCGIIAAITSTADSLLCAIGSNIAQDFDLSFMGSTALRRSKYITLVVGIGTLCASYFVSQNIIGLIISSYELMVSCLFVPLVVSYFTDNVKRSAAIGAIVGGLIGFIGFRIWIPFLPKELLTLGLSLVGYVLGSYIPNNNRN
ncbi:MAG TPA: sodium:solute symporter family protein [Candidatus Dependentiae bacterium]|nr:sodium:solute symporter family protein [Candidatus Dependentiae bacterium]HRQ62757.1 sodium:solute symporter family protein [Candidatus Dependentiae bacterium]